MRFMPHIYLVFSLVTLKLFLNTFHGERECSQRQWVPTMWQSSKQFGYQPSGVGWGAPISSLIPVSNEAVVCVCVCSLLNTIYCIWREMRSAFALGKFSPILLGNSKLGPEPNFISFLFKIFHVSNSVVSCWVNLITL